MYEIAVPTNFTPFCCEREYSHSVKLKENIRFGHTAHTFSRLMPYVLIRERFISMSSGFQMTDDNRFLNFFVQELPLILRIARKLKTGWRYL